MRSLRSRVLVTTSVVLVSFLGCAGFLLDSAFQDSAMQGVEDRLRGRIFMLIGAANLDAQDGVPVLGGLPEPELAIPGSGRYARIFSGPQDVAWSSRSLLGEHIEPPAALAVGQWRLETTNSSAGDRLFALSYGILWEGVGDRAPRNFAIQAIETDQLYRATVAQFRQSLWSWFAGLSIALLFVQGLNISRGLRPLSSVGEEVRAIEHGERDQIIGSYPPELATLTSNLNKLLRQNRESLKRYRNSLGDLAHAIKTPLAILRNEISAVHGDQTEHAVHEQISRIDRTVQYYLQRSANAGRSLIGPAVQLRPLSERVVNSLRKVHAHRELDISLRVGADVSFPADDGDLMEIIGNLADNACKWARHRVTIEISEERSKSDDMPRLVIGVRDDGPGIEAEQLDWLTQRGTRLDEAVEGHGIGLAIVRDIVEDVYAGQLTLDSDGHNTYARAELQQY